MKEIWKDIEGYEGYYQVSNCGQVKSLKRKKYHINRYYDVVEKILKQSPDGRGYSTVKLYKNSIFKNCIVHRLVALAFISNVNNKREVNHKDGNKLNNCIDNLEWVTPSENVKHAFKNGLNKVGKGKYNIHSKVVYQYTKDGILINRFTSLPEASKEIGISKSLISRVCNGIKKSGGGYIWRYNRYENT